MRWSRKDTQVESLDYDPFESVVNTIGLQHKYQRGQEKKRLVYARWIFTAFIGVMTALIAVCMTFSTTYLEVWKLQVMQAQMSSSSPIFVSLGLWNAMNLMFALVAATCTSFVAPVAAGSGISEIKVILNGVKLPKVLRFKTLCCKVLGTICSVAAGLPIGKEGPMIHSGAIIGAGLSQGKSTTWGLDTSFFYFAGFRNDREKRDFVSCGAAAGVAAAFGAPIGGVLFVLEEGASFWHQRLTWRTFFAAMISTFTLTIILSGLRPESRLGSQVGTFSFGSFESSTYKVWEIPLFIMMGVIGGVFGAIFNSLNTKLTQVRSRWIFRPQSLGKSWTPVIEVLILTLLIASVRFACSLWFGSCQARPPATRHYIYRNDLVQFNCDSTTEFNTLATLFLVDGERAIKQLFHAPPDTFSVHQLVLFSVWMFILACLTYGLQIPSGLFVPTLLIGASCGRLTSTCINSWTGPLGLKLVDPRIYGLIGGAAFLGGVTRMTISLAVILLECTGNVEYGLPLIATLFASRVSGNCFNEGMYDIHIHLRHWPFLQWNPPVLGTFLRVKHVMAARPKTFRIIERAGVIYDTLLHTTHHGFPVVKTFDDASNIFSGLICRKHLTMLLYHKDQCLMSSSETNTTRPLLLPYETLEGEYPRYPSIHRDIRLSNEERLMFVNLSPYMNETPHVIQEQAAFTRAYRLFRSSGLRHLVVVDRQNHVTGMITRKDLDEEHCSRCFRLCGKKAPVAAHHPHSRSSFMNNSPPLYPSSPWSLPASLVTKLRTKGHTHHRNDLVRKALQMPLLSLVNEEEEEEEDTQV